MVYYDPRKPKPWPIRLLNRIGIVDDAVATYIVIAIAIIFFSITGYLLLELNSNQAAVDRMFTPAELREIGL